ncbi:MAG: hypothetical protein V4721_03965 [Bacteroidota bacterium]
MKTFKLLLSLILMSSTLCVFAQDVEKPGKKEKVKAEKPFTVYDKSFRVTRVDVRKDTKGAENVIQIDAANAAGGTAMMSTQTLLPPATISNIVIVTGNYNQTRELGKTPRGVSLQLLDVVFPFRARLTISDQYVDVEIREAGFWKIGVALAN